MRTDQGNVLRASSTSPFTWDPEQRLGRVIEILLRDYDATRTEIRTAMGTHEKASFWLSSGLIVALAACFKPEFHIGFAFVPLVILAYYAYRLNRHTLYIAQLSSWMMRIEDLIDRILETDGLLEWERSFVRQRLKIFSPISVASSHYFLEIFLLLPSIVVFAVCLYKRPIPLSNELKVPLALAQAAIWDGYPLLLTILIVVFLSAGSSKELDRARKSSTEKVYESVISHTS
jgi:hypothetical protein